MEAVSQHRFSYVKTIQEKAAAQAKSLPMVEDLVPLMITFERSWPIRSVLFQVAGTILVLGAAGMWVLPGSQVAAELVPMKFGASVFLLFCGMAILMLNHTDNRPDAYFDPIRREVRVLQKNNRGRPQTVLRRSYDSLGSARFSERSMELYDMDGSVLMRLNIRSPEIRRALRMQLCDTVRIVN